MFNIPSSYADEGENYITLTALRNFASDHKTKYLTTTSDRPELIKEINNFANETEENKNIVLNWIDSVLREGTRDVQLQLLKNNGDKYNELFNDNEISKRLEKYIYDNNNRHFCNKCSEELRLFRYHVSEGKCGRVISLYLGKLICFYEKDKGSGSSQYPISVDIFPELGLITSRAKSKSKMYKYMAEFDLDDATTTTSDKENKAAIEYVLKIFDIETKDAPEAFDEFREKLYSMLHKYTKTPTEICKLMNEKTFETEQIIKILCEDICSLRTGYEKDVRSDIQNLIEKYFSITYPDQTIFTENRNAYPLKIIATDDEESKLEQTAADAKPLQSKAVFFDNKKMLQKSKLCDGLVFMFKRIDSKYSTKNFYVRIIAKRNSCTLKFTTYTSEEDIINVLFSFFKS